METIKLPEVPKVEEKKSVATAIKKAENLYAATTRDKRLLIPVVATGAEILALLGLVGLLTLIRADFVWRNVEFVSFCVLVTMRAAVLFLSKDVSGRARVNALKKDTEYKTLVDNYQSEIKDVDPVELDEHLRKVANPKRKIAAYKATIQPKIDKAYAKLAKLDIRLTILAKFKDRSRLKARQYARTQDKITRLNVAVEKYNALISDEYINANFKTLRVKYERLTVEKFMNVEEEENGDLERVTVDSESELKKGILKSLPIALLISAYFALVAWENTVYDHFDWLTFVLDVLLISWYFIQGWFGVGGKVAAAMRAALIRRTLFIKKFKRDKSTKVG